MPSQTFTHSAATAASPEVVWAALDSPATWERIAGVDRVFDPVVDETGSLDGFSFETTAGGRRHLGKAMPLQRVEGEVMAWRIESSEIRGAISVTLTPSAEGTAITVTLDVESVGLLSSMFFPVIAGAIGNSLPKAVDDFAAALSSRA